jgi:hypothetical protein
LKKDDRVLIKFELPFAALYPTVSQGRGLIGARQSIKVFHANSPMQSPQYLEVAALDKREIERAESRDQAQGLADESFLFRTTDAL